MGMSEERLGQLAAMLWEAVMCEEALERRREALANRCDFAPYAAMRLLDYSLQGQLEAFDFVRYFQHYGLLCSLPEAKAIISQFDWDQDGRLSEDEFADMLLPTTNETLRSEASTRVRSSSLTCETLHLLKEVLEGELKYHQNVIKARETLRDCSQSDLLRALGASEGLDRQTLKSLFRKHQYPATEATIDTLLYRWDSQAGKLTLRELSNGHIQPEKGEIYIQGEREEANCLLSPIDPLACSMLTPASDLISFRTSPRNGIPEKASELLVETLLEQLTILREAERMREELALSPDFTPDAAFSLVLGPRKAPIRSEDLCFFLMEWGIQVVKEDSKLLISRYSSSPSLSSFSALLSPQRDAYLSLLNSHPISPKPDLSPATQQLLLDLFRLLLHLEHRSEVLRQGFFASLDLDSLFNQVNTEKAEYLTADMVRYSQFGEFLSGYGVRGSEEELGMLLGRYDRDGDHRVSRRDFRMELTPHSQLDYTNE